MRGREGPPDRRLFRRARQGDRKAFGMLVRRYDPRLRRLALRLVAEPDRIDPLLKRAYVRAWRSLPSVQLPGSVSEWLYRVVYNACINELRWAPDAEPLPPWEGPRVPLPAAPARRRLEGLRALPPEERIPLVLIDGEGFDLEAASRILQKAPAEVAADLSRARGRWRALVVGEPQRRDALEVVELDPDEQKAAEPVDAPHERPRHVRLLGAGQGKPSPKRRPYRPRAIPTPTTGRGPVSNEPVVEKVEPIGPGTATSSNGTGPKRSNGKRNDEGAEPAEPEEEPREAT